MVEQTQNIEKESLKISFKVKFFKNKKTLFGFFILLFLTLLAIFGPFLTDYTYYEINLEMKNLAPCKLYWLGSDELGRDIFTRICFGARISLTIGLAAGLIDVLIGMIYGATSALLGNLADEIMMRLCDILATIPYLLTVILLMAFMQPGILTILVALTLIGWINMARIIRAEILSLKKMPFVQAAKTMGASNFRIIFVHLLPNCMGSIITTLTVTIPLAIFTEAFLSFLGLGIQAPISSWGVMINDSLYSIKYYPWKLFFPASMICLTMLGFNLITDGITQAIDPKD